MPFQKNLDFQNCHRIIYLNTGTSSSFYNVNNIIHDSPKFFFLRGMYKK